MKITSLITFAMASFAAMTAGALTLNLGAVGPVPGANDIYNFSGASHDGGNVNNGSAYADGGANDAFTYIAGDRADQGQTFTTGTNSNGYLVNGVWLRHVGYTTNTALTWWQMNSGVALTVRITDPSLAGMEGFAVHSETYTTTGNEGWSGSHNSTNGDGDWLQFVFTTPVQLSPGKTYGFDIASASDGAFFEWAGTSNGVYAAGTAYNGSTAGGPDNTVNLLTGDRVFLVSLTAATNPIATFNPLVAVPFNLTNVTLLPSQFQTNMLLDEGYLLSLNPDSLLYNFRANVNLSTSNAVPLGGWEAPGNTLCPGHFTGHYLSACAMMYASTGNPQLKARTDYLVAEFAKCQAASPAMGFNAGYLSAFPEYYVNDIINGTQNSYFSVPWYTLHKVMAGLLDAYQYTGNNQALTVLTNMANWVQYRMNQLSAVQIQNMLNYREYGGMNEVLANLYAVTGNSSYLQLAADFDKQSLFVPLSEDDDVLDGLHANTQIPEIIGAAREYEMTGAASYHQIAGFFWTRVADNRSYVIGGDSDSEHFFPVANFPSQVDAETCETCCTYNMLKLTRHIFEWAPSAAAMDFYERGLYNQILGSQEPDEAMMTYFVPLKPGHFKTYSTTNNSFWCCDGTGVENHSKYGDTIYFQGTNSLYVNLFIPSQLNWPAKGVTVVQNTAFPQSDTTTLTFQCTNDTPLTVNIRYPGWAQSGFFVTINGVSQTITNSPGSYVSLARNWRNNDQVLVRIPMTLRVETLQDTSNTVALFYGPILLAGTLGTNGMPASDYAAGQLDLVNVPDPLVPLMVGDTNSLLASVVPVAGQPLTFKTSGVGQPFDVTLIPFYQVQHQRYSVYWNVLSPAAWQQFANSNAVAEAQVVDQVGIGNSASETSHNFASYNSTSGAFNGVNWRDANENLSSNGWFSYSLAVLPNVPMNLACTYWGSDSGNRVFDVVVNGTIVGTQVLTNDNPGTFFTVNYPIPTNLASGATNINVLFSAHPGNIAGGVFGLQTVLATNPGAILGLQMNISSNQTLGSSAQPISVTDYFQTLTNHSVMASSWLMVSSSNTNVLTIGANNQLIPVGIGATTITASYLGYAVSEVISVKPAQLGITRNQGNVLVYWPSNSATLQSTPALGGNSNWSPVTNGVFSSAGTNMMVVPITNSVRYFKLSP